ncbi:stonin-1 [Apodemus sylvaticus]|uniref:stonin-1 n=1 Tax=Apodemus sylvaticus TaxID=10129 RepID=UPI0022431B63|nr:stonin-1 [Apodemus sylvaticus]XP_052042545.1 stonin-1 [Apodemus sylvaticus]XP_052042546.1 stonin-1 [Apodemus sylvaticus]XP_052042547.1 stonin-1 [Apodemus sylvaticus]
MYSTNPGSWVTFDDDAAFQSSQKRKDVSLDTPGVCRPNGLKLNLPGLGDPPSAPCSTSSTPLSSPMVDFYFSPGPPSNSPLSTPTKDFPGFPGIPKAGTHVLYPIPECSSSCPPTTAGGAGPPSSLTKPTCSPSVHSHTQLTPTLGLTEDASPQRAPSEARPFEYFQDDCAFSNPFWKDEGGASRFPLDSRKPFSPKDKEVPIDQKSLNQCSLHYICEKLEHLQSAETQGPLGNMSMQNPYAGDTVSFVPHTLFRSQPKDGWSFMLRIPEKKNMMSSRQWGPIFLKVLPGGILQMYYERGLEKPFKEFQLDPHCRLSEPKLENFSMAGKIHTVKVEHVTYSEKRKYHSKTEVVHEPEAEQMLKLGSTEHRDFLEFLTTVEEELIKLPATAKPKNKNYEEQEICLDILDSFWGKVTKEEGTLVESAVLTQICCLCFLNGPAECFLALNDLELQKRDECYFEKEPEKRGIDILNYHFHTCVKVEEFEQSRIIKFVPLDACRFELMRFKTSYEGDELPFAVKSTVTVQGAYVELQAFVNMTPATQRSPHAASLSCNNIMIHFPVPAQWIKALWTRNLQRQKSLKAKMNRRACLGSLQEPESEPVIQVTVGSAKYESAYRAVVWKIDRLPDKNSSPDQPHCLSYKLELGSDQEVPSDWHPFATVQFSMSEACASRTEVRSLGVESDTQPQKHVRQRAYYNIQVEIEKKWIQVDGEDPDKTGGCVTQ